MSPAIRITGENRLGNISSRKEKIVVASIIGTVSRSGFA
jgi:hypothetical protein